MERIIYSVCKLPDNYRNQLCNPQYLERPDYRIRILNHWDNLDGTIERGYAGHSLWKWDELPSVVSPRYEAYARANASIGINATVINNVNASPKILSNDYLQKVKVLLTFSALMA